MKRILSILAIIVMLASSSVCAAVSFTADYRYDSLNNGFVVYGTTTDTKVGDEITIEAYFDNKIFDTDVTDTFLKDGKTYYESGVITLNAAKPTGKVKFKVYSANHALTLETTEYSYYGMEDAFSVLKTLLGKMKDGDFSGLKSYLAEKSSSEADAPYNYEIIGVDYDLIKDFSTSAGETAGKYAKTVKIDLPETADGNQEEVFEALKAFKNEYFNMSLVGNFANASSKEKFLTWVSDYEATLDLNAYNSDLYSYFSDNYSKSEFYEILSKESMQISEIDKIKDRLIEVGGLTAIKAGNATAVKNMFDKYKDFITLKYSLSEIQKQTVYGNLKGLAFESYEKLAGKYDSLAYDILYSDKGGSSTTSSKNNSKNNVTFSPSTSTDDKKEENTTETFTDMNNASWAKEAVYGLYEKNIVSGKTATEFYPNDNITRAEFVKLLVLSKGSELDANEWIFTDVTADDWYFKYVNKAYMLGIVTGDDMGNFNPNSLITRQDMATMVYRLIGNGVEKGDLSVFTDSDQISDYAKSAVSYLVAEGIINGMGDGSFAPMQNATRAQAAQLIYNIIK